MRQLRFLFPLLIYLSLFPGPLRSQEPPEQPPKDPTAIGPSSALQKNINELVAKELAARLIDLRKEMRAEILAEYQAKVLVEENLRKEYERKLQEAIQAFHAQEKKEEQLRREYEAKLTEKVREYERKLEDVVKEYEAKLDRVLDRPEAALIKPGLKTTESLRAITITTPAAAFTVKGIVAAGNGQGGILIDIGGQVRSYSVGDTFTVENHTFRIVSITPQGANIVAQQTFSLR